MAWLTFAGNAQGVTGLPFESLALMLGYLVGLSVLGFFDIELPRGDSIGVTAALEAVAILALGPAAASAVVLSAFALASTARHLSGRHTSVLSGVLSRVSALAAGITVSMLAPVGLTSSSPIAWAWVGGLVLAYVAVEMIVRQLVTSAGTGRPLLRQLRGNVGLQAPLVLAQSSAAMLVAIVHPWMEAWSLFMAIALLLLIRQSYRLLLGVKETYRTTVEVLVEAAEGADSGCRGHAERTAGIARTIAEKCSMNSKEVDRISFAALLHDVARIRSGESLEVDRATSSQLLEDIDFFRDVVAVLRVCDRRDCDIIEPTPLDLRDAFIVCLASDIDDAQYRIEESGLATARVAAKVPSGVKASAVGAALALGYRIPAVA